ncbi:phage tail protein [Aquibium sp. LZ166]|uniref:Phage tail protein n=1 Tax=Aquibium pacificus TaxID=3153579 RepID=A0ABV3SJH1_9HYPH
MGAGDGQLVPINQNQALSSLLGTTYGGNGQTTFALFVGQPTRNGFRPANALQSSSADVPKKALSPC